MRNPLPVHSVASVFPSMTDEEYQSTKDDIKANGQREEVVVKDGQVIDGRHRDRACCELGIETKVREFGSRPCDGDDVLSFVLSENLKRRHLDQSQKSLVGAASREWYDRQAKERQKDHGKTAPGKGKTLPANLPEVNGDARDQAAKAVGVSGKLIDYATKVIKEGTPELIQAVQNRSIKVSRAAKLSGLPKDEQKQAIKDAAEKKPKVEEPIGDGDHGEDDDAPNKPLARGVGIRRAREAIEILKSIPINDAQRKLGFQLVSRYIRAN